MSNKARNIPWKFIFFQDLLPFADLITDFISGSNYYIAGHRHWAICIWVLMWLPLLLSTCAELFNFFRFSRNKRRRQSSREGTDVEMRTLANDDVEKHNKSETEQTWFQKHEMTIWKFTAQVPFLQPVVHAIFTHKLYKAESGINQALGDYKQLNKEQLGDTLKNDIEAKAEKYVHWKNEKSSILTIFQGIRLFELMGESGPQAILQVSIALRIGYTNWVQVREKINKIIFSFQN